MYPDIQFYYKKDPVVWDIDGDSLHQLCWSSLGDIVPKRSRGIAFGLLEGSISLASAFAPIIGKKKDLICVIVWGAITHTSYIKYHGCEI